MLYLDTSVFILDKTSMKNTAVTSRSNIILNENEDRKMNIRGGYWILDKDGKEYEGGMTITQEITGNIQKWGCT